MTDRPSAVRLFAPEHPSLAHTVRAKLEIRRRELESQLLSSQDWADFKQRAGAIRGIDDAIALCRDAEKDLNGE